MSDPERLTQLEHRMSQVEGRQGQQFTDLNTHNTILIGDGKWDWGLVARVGVLQLLAVGNFVLLLVLLILSIVILTQVF